jgi:two-component system OmpR family sensor kinase
MLVMLASAAMFVYLRLRADLDDSVDASLRSRTAALVEQQGGPTLAKIALEDPEETLVQLVSPTGKLLDSVGTLHTPALSPREARQAMAATLILERDLPHVDGRARVLARSARGDAQVIVVVGRSLLDRDEALSSVVNSFAIGGVVAILLASLIGYLLASLGLAPVEAMRRRARDVSLLPSDQGLPLPAAHDEIRRLGETLNEMLARLRAAFERESRFVADASHELRTPIAIIKTELEGALQVAGPETPGHESLVVAAEECDRLAQLAEDLLVIARSADGQLPVRPEPTHAHVLLGGVRDRFEDRASRRGRSIRVEGRPDLLFDADPVRLRQALGNLVENALRHGRGTIVLVARRSVGGIEIDVTDDGPGFPPQFAAHAFERFARGDRTRTSQGVGLGLAIVQAIAEAHGGNAVVLGTAPTTLRIWLPTAG